MKLVRRGTVIPLYPRVTRHLPTQEMQGIREGHSEEALARVALSAYGACLCTSSCNL